MSLTRWRTSECPFAFGETLQGEVGQGSGKVDAEAVPEPESELVSVENALDAPPGTHRGTVLLLIQPEHVVGRHRAALVADVSQADESRRSEPLRYPCKQEAVVEEL